MRAESAPPSRTRHRTQGRPPRGSWRIVEAIPEGIILIDQSHRVALFNCGAEVIFGYDRTEILGKPLSLLLPERFRAHHPSQVESFARAKETTRFMGERRVIHGLRKDGTEFPAEASIVRFTLNRRPTFAAVIRDISDRIEAEAQMHAAKFKAELASRAKSEFLANMNHELRTPLNAIIDFSDLIATEIFGPIQPAQYRTYAQDIRDSGTHLLELISNILDLSKIEAGRMELDESEVNVAEVVEACLRMVHQRAEQSKLRLHNLVEDMQCKLLADGLMLKQILLNLLTNAIKFTPEGGDVTVSVGPRTGGCVDLAVSDTGVGMAPEDIPKALEPFRQVDNTLRRQHGGVGLGLALTKAQAELHGATLTIASALRAGTTVTVCFPSARVLPSHAAMAKPLAQGARS